MSSVMQDNPLVILAVLVGNSLFFGLLFYCGLRYCIGKRPLPRNVVTQYVIEPQAVLEHPQIHATPDVQNIIIVEHGPRNSISITEFARLSPALEVPVTITHVDNSIDEEPPPPEYFDIYPEEADPNFGNLQTKPVTSTSVTL